MRKALLIVSVAVFGLSFGGGEQAVSTFTDKRDGKVYRIVEADGQFWMAENLNYEAVGSVCYDNKALNCAKYGRLYNWETAMKACPAGFHLPPADEWTALVDYAGGKVDASGKKLKSKAGWADNGNGTDDYGWSALPGGRGYGDGNFGSAGNNGNWWSASEDNANADYAWYVGMGVGGNNEGANWNYIGKTRLLSVRCVADKEGEQ